MIEDIQKVSPGLSPIAIMPDFCRTERGNTWLTLEGDGQRQDVIWISLSEDPNPDGSFAWLEVSITPTNYPAVVIGRLDNTLAQMQHHIHTVCDDWEVQKCNIDGISIVDGRVSAPSSSSDESPESDGDSWEPQDWERE